MRSFIRSLMCIYIASFDDIQIDSHVLHDRKWCHPPINTHKSVWYYNSARPDVCQDIRLWCQDRPMAKTTKTGGGGGVNSDWVYHLAPLTRQEAFDLVIYNTKHLRLVSIEGNSLVCVHYLASFLLIFCFRLTGLRWFCHSSDPVYFTLTSMPKLRWPSSIN